MQILAHVIGFALSDATHGWQTTGAGTASTLTTPHTTSHAADGAYRLGGEELAQLQAREQPGHGPHGGGAHAGAGAAQHGVQQGRVAGLGRGPQRQLTCGGGSKGATTNTAYFASTHSTTDTTTTGITANYTTPISQTTTSATPSTSSTSQRSDGATHSGALRLQSVLHGGGLGQEMLPVIQKQACEDKQFIAGLVIFALEQKDSDGHRHRS